MDNGGYIVVWFFGSRRSSLTLFKRVRLKSKESRSGVLTSARLVRTVIPIHIHIHHPCHAMPCQHAIFIRSAVGLSSRNLEICKDPRSRHRRPPYFHYTMRICRCHRVHVSDQRWRSIAIIALLLHHQCLYVAGWSVPPSASIPEKQQLLGRRGAVQALVSTATLFIGITATPATVDAATLTNRDDLQYKFKPATADQPQIPLPSSQKQTTEGSAEAVPYTLDAVEGRSSTRVSRSC
jgi:hypothetical protein